MLLRILRMLALRLEKPVPAEEVDKVVEEAIEEYMRRRPRVARWNREALEALEEFFEKYKDVVKEWFDAYEMFELDKALKLEKPMKERMRFRVCLPAARKEQKRDYLCLDLYYDAERDAIYRVSLEHRKDPYGNMAYRVAVVKKPGSKEQLEEQLLEEIREDIEYAKAGWGI